MAERRMFAKTIIDSDAFLDMPLSAQALYFHLSMRADDEGFVNNPKKIQRMVGASDDDGKILLSKKFLIAFPSGVMVIKHWRIHNYIQKDRFHPTPYQDELAQLTLKDNNAYTLKTVENTDVLPDVSNLDTGCIQDVYNLDTQVRVNKVNKNKNTSSCDDAPSDNYSLFDNGTSEPILEGSKLPGPTAEAAGGSLAPEGAQPSRSMKKKSVKEVAISDDARGLAQQWADAIHSRTPGAAPMTAQKITGYAKAIQQLLDKGNTVSAISGTLAWLAGDDRRADWHREQALKKSTYIVNHFTEIYDKAYTAWQREQAAQGYQNNQNNYNRGY